MEWVGLVSALLVSVAGTGILRSHALSTGLLDSPNARSSHTVPTPRGGGVAIVLVVLSAIAVLWGSGQLSVAVAIALIGGGMSVAVIGYMDDRNHVPALYRLVVHLMVAVWVWSWLIGPRPAPEEGLFYSQWLVGALMAIALAWMINLYNFMDGIDGLAGSEAVTVGSSAAALLWMSGAPGLAMVAAVTAAASLGFLVWNWPPAKIFMGDVGSGFLGFVFGALALISVVQEVMTPWVWLILLGVFIVDATMTLVRRFLDGERVYEAHRSHAYQQAVRRWGGHRPVTLAVVAVNMLWLLPLAALATRLPGWGAAILVAAWTPVGMTCWWICRKRPHTFSS